MPVKVCQGVAPTGQHSSNLGRRSAPGAAFGQLLGRVRSSGLAGGTFPGRAATNAWATFGQLRSLRKFAGPSPRPPTCVSTPGAFLQEVDRGAARSPERGPFGAWCAEVGAPGSVERAMVGATGPVPCASTPALRPSGPAPRGALAESCPHPRARSAQVFVSERFSGLRATPPPSPPDRRPVPPKANRRAPDSATRAPSTASVPSWRG